MKKLFKKSSNKSINDINGGLNSFGMNNQDNNNLRCLFSIHIQSIEDFTVIPNSNNNNNNSSFGNYYENNNSFKKQSFLFGSSIDDSSMIDVVEDDISSFSSLQQREPSSFNTFSNPTTTSSSYPSPSSSSALLQKVMDSQFSIQFQVHNNNSGNINNNNFNNDENENYGGNKPFKFPKNNGGEVIKQGSTEFVSVSNKILSTNTNESLNEDYEFINNYLMNQLGNNTSSSNNNNNSTTSSSTMNQNQLVYLVDYKDYITEFICEMKSKKSSTNNNETILNKENYGSGSGNVDDPFLPFYLSNLQVMLEDKPLLLEIYEKVNPLTLESSRSNSSIKSNKNQTMTTDKKIGQVKINLTEFITPPHLIYFGVGSLNRTVLIPMKLNTIYNTDDKFLLFCKLRIHISSLWLTDNIPPNRDNILKPKYDTYFVVEEDENYIVPDSLTSDSLNLMEQLTNKTKRKSVSHSNSSNGKLTPQAIKRKSSYPLSPGALGSSPNIMSSLNTTISISNRNSVNSNNGNGNNAFLMLDNNSSMLDMYSLSPSLGSEQLMTVNATVPLVPPLSLKKSNTSNFPPPYLFSTSPSKRELSNLESIRSNTSSTTTSSSERVENYIKELEELVKQEQEELIHQIQEAKQNFFEMDKSLKNLSLVKQGYCKIDVNQVDKLNDLKCFVCCDLHHIGDNEKIWNIECINYCIDIYTKTIRKCAQDNFGFEMYNTENLITNNNFLIFGFEYAKQALKFTLYVHMKLMEVDWPEELLSIPSICVFQKNNVKLLYRGLRCRMGVCCKDDNHPTSLKTIQTALRILQFGQGGQTLVESSVMEELMNETNNPNIIEKIDCNLPSIDSIVQKIDNCYYLQEDEEQYDLQHNELQLDQKKMTIYLVLPKVLKGRKFKEFKKGNINGKEVCGEEKHFPIQSSLIINQLEEKLKEIEKNYFMSVEKKIQQLEFNCLKLNDILKFFKKIILHNSNNQQEEFKKQLKIEIAKFEEEIDELKQIDFTNLRSKLKSLETELFKLQLSILDLSSQHVHSKVKSDSVNITNSNHRREYTVPNLPTNLMLRRSYSPTTSVTATTVFDSYEDNNNYLSPNEMKILEQQRPSTPTSRISNLLKLNMEEKVKLFGGGIGEKTSTPNSPVSPLSNNSSGGSIFEINNNHIYGNSPPKLKTILTKNNSSYLSPRNRSLSAAASLNRHLLDLVDHTNMLKEKLEQVKMNNNQ
ncbi:hypothetical protein ABK040_005869 [Willaertia magna]